VKKILIGLGALFFVIIALFGWLAVSGSQFRKEQASFVETFVTDLSKRWNIEDVYDRLATPFIEEAYTPQAQQLLHQFKQLGALKSVRDLKLGSYNANNNGRSGNFTFMGTFENGEAAVEVNITKKDGTVRVLGFHLTETRIREGVSKLRT